MNLTSWTRDMTLDLGEPLPAIELVDHEGRPWHTVEMRGRPLVLILQRHLASVSRHDGHVAKRPPFATFRRVISS